MDWGWGGVPAPAKRLVGRILQYLKMVVGEDAGGLERSHVLEGYLGERERQQGSVMHWLWEGRSKMTPSFLTSITEWMMYQDQVTEIARRDSEICDMEEKD